MSFYAWALCWFSSLADHFDDSIVVGELRGGDMEEYQRSVGVIVLLTFLLRNVILSFFPKSLGSVCEPVYLTRLNHLVVWVLLVGIDLSVRV
jgi:hypothetical protein